MTGLHYRRILTCMKPLAIGMLSLMLTGCATALPGNVTVIPKDTAVEYSVTGNSTASITYMTVDNGDIGQESANATTLPFTKELTVTDGGMLSYTALTLVAVGNETTETLSCKITQDGEVIAEQTSTGPFATVTCGSTNR